MLNVIQSQLEGTVYSDIEKAINEPSNQPSISTRAPRFDSLERLTRNMKQYELVRIVSNNKNVGRRCRVCYSCRETAYMYV